MKYFIFFILILGKAQIVSAQIDGSILNNYTHQWQVYLEDSSGKQLVRIWTDYGEIIELFGKHYFHRVQDLYNASGKLESTWINMVEHQSLYPWYFQSVSPSGNNVFIEFANKRYTTSIFDNMGELNRDTIYISEQLYDWNLYGILLAALPLEKGVVYTLPVLNSNTLQPDQIRIMVSNREKITTIQNKEIVTWKVDTDKNLTFWVSKSAPYVLQLRLTLSNGNIMWWYSCL